MKKNILLSIIILTITQLAFSQCKEYIKAITPSMLEPYVSDGNFFAPTIYEGDEVILKRTFIGGQQYKIMVLGMDLWQKFITIKDDDGFTLFQNFLPKKHKQLNCSFTDWEGNSIPCLGQTYFEFKPQHTITLIIRVKVQKIAKRKKDRVKGCLGIIVGYLPQKTEQ